MARLRAAAGGGELMLHTMVGGGPVVLVMPGLIPSELETFLTYLTYLAYLPYLT